MCWTKSWLVEKPITKIQRLLNCKVSWLNCICGVWSGDSSDSYTSSWKFKNTPLLKTNNKIQTKPPLKKKPPKKPHHKPKPEIQSYKAESGLKLNQLKRKKINRKGIIMRNCLKRPRRCFQNHNSTENGGYSG